MSSPSANLTTYWETGRAQARAAGQAPPPATVPAGFTFAALEEPELFVTELQAPFRSLRSPQMPEPRR
jgi:hypothetical protein